MARNIFAGETYGVRRNNDHLFLTLCPPSWLPREQSIIIISRIVSLAGNEHHQSNQNAAVNEIYYSACFDADYTAGRLENVSVYTYTHLSVYECYHSYL